MDAVEHLLESRTIGELSVEDIAAEAGISRSGFYFYFESKYAALADALSDVADAIEGAADDFFGDTGREPRDYVNDALTGVATMWRKHADLLVAVVDAAHSDSGARTLWDDWRQRFVDGIARTIEEERRAGRAHHNGVSTEDLARVLLAMNLGTLYDLARNRASDEEAERAVSALAWVWLSAVWHIDPAR